MKKYPVYYVEWRDSASQMGWFKPENKDAFGVATIASVGWLVYKTPKEIALTTSLSEWSHATDPITIPREAITRMKRLKIL